LPGGITAWPNVAEGVGEIIPLLHLPEYSLRHCKQRRSKFRHGVKSVFIKKNKNYVLNRKFIFSEAIA